MKQRFQSFDFRIPTLGRIKTINDIIAQYAAQGYRLTLRQVYYQHVARGMIPNNEREYKKLGSILNDGRLAGLIDWDSIEDRTRTLRGLPSWDDPSGIIASAYHSFKLDRWDRQPNRVEVWIEKDALIGVIERTCQRHDVNFFSCRGYVSQSEMYVAAQRLQGYIDAGQDVHVLHLGDHDPSGIDMTRDIESRLTLFLDGLNCNMNRLALNIDQVQQYSPPPNPAKMTDSRFAAYIHRFGKSSWELDALDPSVLDSLIETEIENLRDPDIWDETLEEEKHHKDLLRDTSRRWKEVAAFLEA